MIRRIFISFGCLAAGLVVGFMMRSHPAEQTARGARAGKEKSHETEALPVAAALTSPGQRVLAWLSSSLPVPEHFMEMPELSLDDLKNIEALSSTDFPVLVPRANDGRRQRLLLERWAETDAKSLVAWLEPLARLYDPAAGIWFSGYMREPGSPLFHAGVRALNRVDPETAKALSLKGGGQPLLFLQASIDQSSVKVAPAPPPPPPDPDFTAMSGAAAWKWLKEHNRTQDLRVIAEALVKSDPARAVAWLDEMPLIYERASPLNAALLAATRKNPDFLLTVLDKFPSASDLKYALQNCQGLNGDHLPRIEAWAVQCGDQGVRRMAIEWLAGRRGRSNPDGAMEWINQLPQEADRAAAMECLASRWPNPAETAQRLVSEGRLPNESKVLSMLATRWAEKDRAAALAWAQSLPSGGLKSQAIGGVWSAWMQADPETAIVSAGALTGTERRAGLQAVASSWWARQYPGKAFQWIANLPMPEQPSALAATAPDFPNNVNGAALEAITRTAGAVLSPDDTPAFLRLVRQMTSREISRNAEAAAEWAKTLPAGEVRREALTVVVDEMVSKSWEKGSAWVAALPAADQAALRQ